MSNNLNKKISLLTILVVICIIMCLFNMISNSRAYAIDNNPLYTRDELSNIVSDNSFFLKSYPVGSVYITTNSDNPGDTYGGTWESYGTGKTLVGVDTNDSDFNLVEKTGGAKTHYHVMPIGYDYIGNYIYYNTNSSFDPIFGSEALNSQYAYFFSSPAWNKTTDGAVRRAYTDVSSTLQPYITTYMWKRTA